MVIFVEKTGASVKLTPVCIRLQLFTLGHSLCVASCHSVYATENHIGCKSLFSVFAVFGLVLPDILINDLGIVGNKQLAQYLVSIFHAEFVHIIDSVGVENYAVPCSLVGEIVELDNLSVKLLALEHIAVTVKIYTKNIRGYILRNNFSIM